MLEFLRYLKENYKEDVSSVEKIISEKWNKTVEVIKAAFDDNYVDKKTAIFKIQNEFLDNKIAPKNVDVNFIKENLNYIIEKINSLDEGDVKIIINTGDVQKGSARTSITGMETESKKSKKKNVVKEEMDDDDNISGEIGGMVGFVGGDEEDEKIVKVSVDSNMVTVEPSENTGLEKSEHEFEDEEAASSFVTSLENLFKGFRIDKEEVQGVEGNEFEEVGVEKETQEESTKIKKRLVSEAEGDEEPEDAGEEPEDAGEEPEDAGEEPEDAGEEPEDAGDINWEDIDAEEGDAEECVVAPVRSISPMKIPEFESLDLSKLINTIVRVKDKWYNVNSITENNEIVGVDKEGNKVSFNLEQIDEMEQTIDDIAQEEINDEIDEFEPEEDEIDEFEPEEDDCFMSPSGRLGSKTSVSCGGKFIGEFDSGEEALEAIKDWQKRHKYYPNIWNVSDHGNYVLVNAEEETEEPSEEECASCKNISKKAEEEIEDESEEEVGIQSVLSPEQLKIVKGWINTEIDELPVDIYEILFDYYSDEMPYGVQTAKEGDPYVWISDRVSLELGQENIRMLNAEEESCAAEEETTTQEESLSFVKIASRKYFDIDEDVLVTPSMVNTQIGGLTSKVGKIDQKILDVKPAPKAPIVKAPTAALTSTVGKIDQKLEKIKSAPTAQVKKGPQNAFTKSPKAPPKKVEKVKAAPKVATKVEPKANLTSKVGKTGQRVEKVKAPQIDKDYKKGGAKG